MNTFQTIFFQIMSFCAGGMTFVNLAHLIPGSGEGYDYSWTKVVVLIILGIVFAAAAHMERGDHHRLPNHRSQ